MELTRLLGTLENSEFDYYLKVKSIFVNKGFLLSQTESINTNPLFAFFDFYGLNVEFVKTPKLGISIFLDDELVFESKNKKVVLKLSELKLSIIASGTLRNSDYESINKWIKTNFSEPGEAFRIKLLKSGNGREIYESFMDSDKYQDLLDFDEVQRLYKDEKKKVLKFSTYGLKDVSLLKILFHHTVWKNNLVNFDLQDEKGKKILIRNAYKAYNKFKRAQVLAVNVLKKNRPLNLAKNFTNTSFL